jgi:cytochrome c1
MNTILKMTGMKQLLLGAVALGALTIALPPASATAQEQEIIPRQDWTFSGLFGHYDQEQLRRGFKVYKNVCSACHSMNLLSYRNLGQAGGPDFPEAVVKAIAAEATVTDGPNDQGEMFERPAKPSDRFVAPFKNTKEAAAANNGAVPPDLSIIAKAREVEHEVAWYLSPFEMLKDIFSQYQESGSDYVYSLLTGFGEPPADFHMAPGMNYNAAFPGHQIAMPPPLSDGVVPYEDGTPTTVSQYAKDVTAFLTWASEPHMEERKKLGLRVIFYLIILTGLLYLSKRALWRKLH